MKRLLLLLAAAILLAACGGKKMPDGVIEHDRMVPLLVDIYLVEAYYAVKTNYNYDTLSPDMLRAYDDVLAEHGVTPDDLEASLAYYSEHAELYNAIHRDVVAVLNEKNTGEAEEATPVKVNVQKEFKVFPLSEVTDSCCQKQ